MARTPKTTAPPAIPVSDAELATAKAFVAATTSDYDTARAEYEAVNAVRKRAASWVQETRAAWRAAVKEHDRREQAHRAGQAAEHSRKREPDQQLVQAAMRRWALETTEAPAPLSIGPAPAPEPEPEPEPAPEPQAEAALVPDTSLEWD